jgi:hypothetical protein
MTPATHVRRGEPREDRGALPHTPPGRVDALDPEIISADAPMISSASPRVGSFDLDDDARRHATRPTHSPRSAGNSRWEIST